MIVENNWYLYRHLKPDGEVFYIGIGKQVDFNRAYEKIGRNTHWKNVIKKYKNYEVQILSSGLTELEAIEIEIDLIAWYGRYDLGKGKLVNKTNGGDGTKGMLITEEERVRRVNAIIGENNPMYGKCGNLHHSYGLKRSKEARGRISSSNKGKPSLKGGEHPNSKLVLDNYMGIFYDSLVEASAAINVNYEYLKRMMRGARKNKTNLIYI